MSATEATEKTQAEQNKQTEEVINADTPQNTDRSSTTANPTAATTMNKKARKLDKNPDAGLGSLRPAVSKKAEESESGPSKEFAGLSRRDEKRLYTTFKSRKQLWLAEIAKHSTPINSRDEADKSNKGFIDTRCLPIIELLNAHEDYVTTSSCSGRICLFHSIGALGAEDPVREGEGVDEVEEGGSASAMKRGADGSLGWILASHESPLSEDQIQLILRHTVPGHSGSTENAIVGKKESDCRCCGDDEGHTAQGASSPAAVAGPVAADVNGCMVADRIPTKGQVSLKCEPFLLHVQCRTIEAAKKLLNAAHEAGFRNSGMIPPGKNIMVGIRHASLSIDAPIVADGGISFASEDYVRYLVKVAEEKMEENFKRTLMLEKSMARWIKK